MFVKPKPYINEDGVAEGLCQIVDPDLLDVLPAEGREVPENEYWARRLRDGDIEVTTPAAALVVIEDGAPLAIEGNDTYALEA